MAPLSPSTPNGASSGQRQEQPGHASPAVVENEKAEYKNMVVRFLLVVRTILCSSIINVLLVFVPVGIAVRKLPGAFVGETVNRSGGF